MTSPETATNDGYNAEAVFDAIVIGAGFAGMYMIYRLREQGLSVRGFEVGADVGGTWYWNRYPGARVDVPSSEYSYSFSLELETEWRWSEKYSSQPELLRYANHVADRFDLRREISFNTRISAAIFDEASGRWTVRTDDGRTFTAKYCIMATGNLSVPKDIDLPGIADFEGDVHRTSRWPAQPVDFTGKRVAVVGTGSSGIQAVPVIAETAGHMTVFQRTANFSLPSRNGPAEAASIEDWLTNRELYRTRQRDGLIPTAVNAPPMQSAHSVTDEERRAIYEKCWDEGGFSMITSFYDLVLDQAANDTVADFVREKIRGLIRKSDVAEKLLPTSHPIMTKRPCVDSGYFEAFNRDNVDLVDLRETPIERVTPTGILTSEGERPFDIIVLAIGFDAMTGALNRIDIRGRDGASLKEHWAHGPRTYLGLAVPGFPNLFTITGPGSPSVLVNVVMAIEQHVEWIANAIRFADDNDLATIEATVSAQDAWVDEVNALAASTLYPLANSWYMGANVPGKPRVFMPYVGAWKDYRDRCSSVAENGYEGFTLVPNAKTSDGAVPFEDGRRHERTG